MTEIDITNGLQGKILIVKMTEDQYENFTYCANAIEKNRAASRNRYAVQKAALKAAQETNKIQETPVNRISPNNTPPKLSNPVGRISPNITPPVLRNPVGRPRHTPKV